MQNYRIKDFVILPGMTESIGVMKSHLSLNANQRGFSLVELLVVIAVIAIIAAIAIPNIANISSQTNAAKDQRNAQTVANVAAAAKAAGVTNDLHLKSTVIGLLEGSGLENPAGMRFGISPLSADEETGALNYLEDGDDTNSTVLYSSEPVGTNAPVPTPTP